MNESNQDHLDSEVIVALLGAVRAAADDELGEPWTLEVQTWSDGGVQAQAIHMLEHRPGEFEDRPVEATIEDIRYRPHANVLMYVRYGELDDRREVIERRTVRKGVL